MYIFMYNADARPYSDDTMCFRISIDYRNDYCSDDISVLICRWYLFVLLHHVADVVTGKIFFVGS